MKKEIATREDLHFIITAFYEKLTTDAEMAPFFEEIVQQNHLEIHIDTITDFWQDVLLHTNRYQNNVLQKHLDFNKKVPFKKAHFTKWLLFLTTTINTSFEGQIAQNIIDRANSIATVLQVKMKLYN
ncbi:MAG: group III truncated hemoglobin [Polaribacter sp.]|nr:group III truncated hemoglobin [Polaribacter sp.]MDG1993915.1 group III truncated hemoglobin [Polaribacter sp.]